VNLVPKVDRPGDWTEGIQADAYSFGQIGQIIGNRCPEVCQNVYKDPSPHSKADCCPTVDWQWTKEKKLLKNCLRIPMR